MSAPAPPEPPPPPLPPAAAGAAAAELPPLPVPPFSAHSAWALALALGLLALLPALERSSGAPPAALRARAPPCADCALRAQARAYLLDTPATPRAPYSSFTCTAGSQAFQLPWHVFTHNFKEPSWVGHRMCVARDVCVVGGTPTFYTDAAAEARTPPALRLGALAGAGFLYRGAYAAGVGAALQPAVVAGPRPPHLPYAPPGRLYLASALNNAQNYAHLLLDTVLPAYSAADFYGLGVEDVQHVGLNTCDSFENSGWVGKGSGASHAAACYANFDKWYAPLMPHAYLDGGARDACYGALVLGHEAVFASASFGAHFDRARAARALAARAAAHAAGAGFPIAPPHPAAVLVLLQHNPVNAPSAFPDLCALVQGAAANASGGAAGGAENVRCSTPGAQSVAEQVADAGSAGVLVCEHGSTCYAALFCARGAGVVVLVPSGAKAAKEGHVLLFLPDVAVYYLGEGEARGGGLAGALELALRGAAGRMGAGAGAAE